MFVSFATNFLLFTIGKMDIIWQTEKKEKFHDE